MKIVRELFPEIIKYLDIEKIIIIKGARQVGKTTIMEAIQNYLIDRGDHAFYISADEDFDDSVFKTPQHFMARLESEISPSRSKTYVLIDEFQYINDAGRFIKVLHDKHRHAIQLIVSGSSSLKITKSTEFLTGRKIEVQAEQLSFAEFVKRHEPGIERVFTDMPYQHDKWRLLYDVHRTRLEILFALFVRFGGYPEIVTTEDYDLKKRLIRELFSTYIQKDIIAFLKVENVSAFNNLLKVFCSEAANLLNKNSLANTLGISINTLNKYIDILQGTYVCTLLPPFYSNTRKEVSKMKKIFINDSGLRNFMLNRFPFTYDDINGQDAENLAFLALKRCIDKEKLFYFRTISKSEIDFIIDDGETKDAVEVKFQNNVAALPVAMRNFAKNYNTRRFIIVTKKDFKVSANTDYVPLPLFEFFIKATRKSNIYGHFG